MYIFIALFPLWVNGQQVHLSYEPDTTFVSKLPAIRQKPAYLVVSRSTIPADLYTQHFGFFCRQELKMHKANIPMSFRLGSMEYCNMLEQKGNGAK